MCFSNKWKCRRGPLSCNNMRSHRLSRISDHCRIKLPSRSSTCNTPYCHSNLSNRSNRSRSCHWLRMARSMTHSRTSRHLTLSRRSSSSIRMIQQRFWSCKRTWRFLSSRRPLRFKSIHNIVSLHSSCPTSLRTFSNNNNNSSNNLCKLTRERCRHPWHSNPDLNNLPRPSPSTNNNNS